ncbi:unnamed protein product [Lota lota]
MLVPMLPLVLLLASQRVQGLRQNVTLAIILPQKNTDYPWAWPRIGPAVERAIRVINSDAALLPNHRLQYFFKSSENKAGICSETIAPLMAVDLKLLHDPWVFIGPGCSYSASPVGLFTSHWDVPMVTAGAPAVAFDKSVYHSVTNTGPTHKKLGKFALRICERFQWREHVLLLFNDNKVDDRPCFFAVEGLFTELGKANITLVDMVFNEKQLPVNYSDIIPDIHQTGRVVFSCCSPDVFRQMMVRFHQAALLPQKEYVFFYIDVFGQSLKDTQNKPWARGDHDDPVAMEAYKSVKILTYSEPQNKEYKDFVSHLKSDAIKNFNFTIDDSLMNIIPGGFYDGLMMYTHALNETLTASGERPPGKKVTEKMWNRTYHGALGADPDWHVEYPEPFCVVENSTTTIPCSFTHPVVHKKTDVKHRVTRVVWCPDHNVCWGTLSNVYDSWNVAADRWNVTADSRFVYLGDRVGNCTLQIIKTLKGDAATYRFRFVTNANGYTGEKGVRITVTSKCYF